MRREWMWLDRSQILHTHILVLENCIMAFVIYTALRPFHSVLREPRFHGMQARETIGRGKCGSRMNFADTTRVRVVDIYHGLKFTNLSRGANGFFRKWATEYSEAAGSGWFNFAHYGLSALPHKARVILPLPSPPIVNQTKVCSKHHAEKRVLHENQLL